MQQQLTIFLLVIVSNFCFQRCVDNSIGDGEVKIGHYYYNLSGNRIKIITYYSYGKNEVFTINNSDTLSFEWDYPVSGEEVANYIFTSKHEYYLGRPFSGDSVVISSDSSKCISYKNYYGRNDSVCEANMSIRSPFCLKDYTIIREDFLQYYYAFTKEDLKRLTECAE